MCRNIIQKFIIKIISFLICILIIILTVLLLRLTPLNVQLVSSIGGTIGGVLLVFAVRPMITRNWQVHEANPHAILSQRALIAVGLGGAGGSFLLQRMFLLESMYGIIAAF
ncbi:MAG: hypothetical protein HC822_05255 [Oscillochloris sp.]|nr:hypothetical protein [Oscillochloris sp.]